MSAFVTSPAILRSALTLRGIERVQVQALLAEGGVRDSRGARYLKGSFGSHIERQNLTLRMQIRRLTRLTNAFSKKLDNLKAALALHFAYYNFCRVHKTLQVTPAMEAVITGHIWTLTELL
jgi:hypothetical protein